MKETKILYQSDQNHQRERSYEKFLKAFKVLYLVRLKSEKYFFDILGAACNPFCFFYFAQNKLILVFLGVFLAFFSFLTFVYQNFYIFGVLF
jgi:hypothetical protein